MNTSTYHVGGVSFPNFPIMIGAGACKIPEETRKWLQVAPVVSGSYTPEERAGNEGAHLFFPETEAEFLEKGFGLNSFGMPNMGIAGAVREFSSFKTEQPIIISIAGFSMEDYMNGVSAICKNPDIIFAAIELNFGCPNTGHGKIMSFDPELLNALFFELSVRNYPIPIWAKLSPYSDPGLLKEVADVMNVNADVIDAVVACNTFPNAYAGAENISPNNGLAGLSGPALKPIALGQVVQFRQHLGPKMDIIGVGGITTGNDVIDFFDAGASAVQLTSMPHWSGNPGEFWERLLNPQDGDRLDKHLTDDN